MHEHASNYRDPVVDQFRREGLAQVASMSSIVSSLAQVIEYLQLVIGDGDRVLAQAATKATSQGLIVQTGERAIQRLRLCLAQPLRQTPPDLLKLALRVDRGLLQPREKTLHAGVSLSRAV